MTEKMTDFGYEQVPLNQKQAKVNEVFSSVASKYDIMNDLMSAGLHRVWKKQAIQLLRLDASQCVLDLAGGTGDLTHQILKHPKAPKQCVLADINLDMLKHGRGNLLNKGVYQMDIMNVDAQHLPFADESFDRIIIGFGLRNVAQKELALAEMARVLKPGGMLLVLEFSQVDKKIKPLYDLYSFKVLPTLGKLIANDSGSYQYLAESIRKHPNQQALKSLILEQAFEQCEVFNLSMGLVAIHRAIKSHDDNNN